MLSTNLVMVFVCDKPQPKTKAAFLFFCLKPVKIDLQSFIIGSVMTEYFLLAFMTCSLYARGYIHFIARCFNNE